MILTLLLVTADPVFVQATRANLREQPNASAKLRHSVRIGGKCAVLGEADGWLQVECSGLQGYSKADLFGSEPPSLDALMAKAKGDGELQERLHSAERATALSGDVEKVGSVWRGLYVEAELQSLKNVRGQAKPPKTKTLSAECPELEEKCALELAEGEVGEGFVAWARLHRSGKDAVLFAFLMNSQLYVAAGAFTVSGTQASLLVERSSKSNTSPEMLTALNGSGGARYPRTCHAGDDWSGVGSDKAIVLDDCMQKCNDACFKCHKVCTRDGPSSCLEGCPKTAASCRKSCQ